MEKVKVYKTSNNGFFVLSERSYSVIDAEKGEAVCMESIGLKTSVWREKIGHERLEELQRLYDEQRAQRDRETAEWLEQIKSINFQLNECKKHWREANEKEKQANSLSYQANNKTENQA